MSIDKSTDFIRQIDHVDIGKYNHVETRDRGIRLYCTASAETHGSDNARYALQVFAPMKLANGQEGVTLPSSFDWTPLASPVRPGNERCC